MALCSSCFDAPVSSDKSNHLYKSFSGNDSAGVDYDFLDSLTLTDYSISLPADIDCSEIYNIESLLSCFPELSDVVKTTEEMSQRSFAFLEVEPDVIEYSPEGHHFYYLEIFTDVVKRGDSEVQVIKYSLHPRGGTLQIDAGVLAVPAPKLK